MSPTDHREVERKYDVADEVIVPPLHELPDVVSVQPLEHRLEATYYDTDDLALAAARVTLRRRTGGDDAGWHLKLPVGQDERAEVREPLGADEDGVPASLLALVRVHVRDRPLQPVVQLSTRRVVHRLRADDAVLAELCDDTVTATAHRSAGTTTTWREWEVELVDGDIALLEAADALVREAGAVPAQTSSKLLRALGDDPRLDRPEVHEVGDPSGPAATVLLAHASEQVAELKSRDPQVRRDQPDAVHKMRVATRRLRSALATYRPLYDRDVTDPVRDELKWLADLLGAARDAEVMGLRHRELVDGQPPELVMGPVARRLDTLHTAARRAAMPVVADALDSERYFRLLDRLDALVATPPWSADADEPAEAVLPRRVRREWKRLRRRHDAVETGPAEERDERLHEARKSAKRLRYANEVLEPVYGTPAKKLAKAAERLQDALGDHHDSVVSRATLREVGVQAHLDGENAFSYGRLHALEQARADADEAAYARGWKKVDRRRRWLADATGSQGS